MIDHEMHDTATVADLIRELRDETSTLLRQEVQLAKVEISEKISRTLRNIAFLVVGGLVAYLALVFLTLSLTNGVEVGLTEMISPATAVWLAPLLVALGIGFIGLVLVQRSLASLKEESVVPKKTVQSLKEDKQWIQDKVT